jgi:Domain of unknown function (DUF4276)
MLNLNPNSILFLYEGDTEREFYEIVFKKYLSNRKIRLSFNNLKGITTDINKKVEGKIIAHLANPDHQDRMQIHVFIAIDREGPKTTLPLIDIQALRKRFIKKNSRINSINAIIATQDFESWLFHDIDGIYTFLKVPSKERNIQKFSNIEKTNNRVLSQLFRTYGKTYFKGTKVHCFLETLDIEKICTQCHDLKIALDKMRKLALNNPNVKI